MRRLRHSLCINRCRCFAAGLILLVSGCAHFGKSPADFQDLQHAIQKGEQAYSTEHYSKAESHWLAGLEIARELNANAMSGRLQHDLAKTQEIQGKYSLANDNAKACLNAADRLNDSRLKADCLNLLSLLNRRNGLLDDAVSHARHAVELAMLHGYQEAEADGLRNLGAAQLEQDASKSALEHFQESYNLSKQIEYRSGIIKALNSIGGLYRRQAQYSQALENYNQALQLSKKSGSRLQQARVNGNLCLLYLNLSRYRMASQHCDMALAMSRRIDALPLQANSLNNLAAVYSRQGKILHALDSFMRAAEIKQHMGDRRGYARSLNNIGNLYVDNGDLKNAEPYLQQSLKIKQELGDLRGQAATHGNLGRIYRAQGRHQQAIEQFRKALAIQIASNDLENLWRTYDNLSISYTEAGPGYINLAIFLGKQAINTIQRIRREIKGVAGDYQKSYIKARMDVYRRLADLLLSAGRFLEAEQVLAMLKEEEYLNYAVRSGTEDQLNTVLSLSVEEQNAQERYRAISAHLVEIGKAYAELSRKTSANLTEAEQARYQMLEDALVLAAETFDQFLIELADKKHLPDKPGFSEHELAALRSFQGSLQELDDRALLLHFIPLPDRLRIIVTSSRQYPASFYRDSDITHDELRQLILKFRDSITSRSQETTELAGELYDHLFDQVEQSIEQLNVDTLLVYLDQELRYLPVAALHDGEKYLAEKYATVVYTPATQNRLVKRQDERWKVAAMGVSKAFLGFPALPSVIDELDEIVREDENDQTGVLSGISRLDEDFTETSFAEALKQDYSVVHIASHFNLNPGSLGDSFLLIGNGKKLMLSDMNRIRYPLNKVDLLTLSACQTALGGGAVEGQEFESFSVKAQLEGAASVVATLWMVADDSTGKFMRYFYNLHQTYQLSKAEAMRMTQELFINGEVGQPDGGVLQLRGIGSGSSSSERYSHPYFWAPFVLSGNWL